MIICEIHVHICALDWCSEQSRVTMEVWPHFGVSWPRMCPKGLGLGKMVGHVFKLVVVQMIVKHWRQWI